MGRILVLSMLLASCATGPGPVEIVENFNRKQEQNFMPTRAQYTRFSGGASSLEFGIWAGEVGESAASEAHRQKILEMFERECGFSEKDLKETRIVEHRPMHWYEVWVFHDLWSPRPDHTSGVSVVMDYDPETNRSRTSFHGGCGRQERPPG